ncbi:MAG: proteasome accessory factor PafA2 family protein [Pirellulaceae bacterium]|nr:proteasome accessory factor PafA2 family protein [Pirellulaceae bacterium]
MADPQTAFVFGVETECLTAVPDEPDRVGEAITRFLDVLARQTPSLPARNGGVFTTYGRFYCDCGHIEIAGIECDSPYTVPLIMERLHTLAAEAVRLLAADGLKLVLANNNHSGLLRAGCATWGYHENYLVGQHPSSFTEHILPFLVTRIYGGAGGVAYPSGRFVAGVRSTCLRAASGGGTTDMRAIHSLARDEHHMGPSPNAFRYHLILGDGHRSQYNVALLLGATALAIKAVTTDDRLRRDVAVLRRDFSADWLTTLQEVNVLADGAGPARIHPLVLKTQQLYLEGARRWVARYEPSSAWIRRLLTDWQDTLSALEQMNRSWLARRLDAFAKLEICTALLADAGLTRAELTARHAVFSRLALLEQNYHEFCNPASAFAQLERAGAMDHRVGPYVAPGGEPEAYIPEVNTRACARARLICQYQHDGRYVADWSHLYEVPTDRLLRLYDPFSVQPDSWLPSGVSDGARSAGSGGSPIDLGDLWHLLERGHLDDVSTRVRRLELAFRVAHFAIPRDLMRCKARIAARCGTQDGEQLLRAVSYDDCDTVQAIADYCCIYRYAGLAPDLERMEPWIEHGRRYLAGGCLSSHNGEALADIREHAAVALTAHGRLNDALALLEPVRTRAGASGIGLPARARLTAALGEVQRRMGHRKQARASLYAALRIEESLGLEGQMAYGTLQSLAKCERLRSRSLRWLERAAEIQMRNGDRLGHAATLLREARIHRDRVRATDNLARVTQYRELLPALAQCPLMSLLLDRWDDWTSGADVPGTRDAFWGL